MEFRPFPCQRAPPPPFSLLQNPLNFFLLTVYKTIPRWIESKCVIPVVPVIMITLPTSLWPRNHNVISRDLKPATLRFYEGRSTFIRFLTGTEPILFQFFFLPSRFYINNLVITKRLESSRKRCSIRIFFFFSHRKQTFPFHLQISKAVRRKIEKFARKPSREKLFFFFFFESKVKGKKSTRGVAASRENA